MPQDQNKYKTLIGIWNFLSSTGQMATISVQDIQKVAQCRGLRVKDIDEVTYGFNSILKAVKISTDEGIALYPRQMLKDIEMYNKNIVPLQAESDFWKSVDWFYPPYTNRTEINDARETLNINFSDLQKSNKKKLQEDFEHCFSSIYNLEKNIAITCQILTDSKVLSKHVPLIKESIMAFYSGMKVASIAALIPMIENIMTSIIGQDKPELNMVDKVNTSINLAIENVKKLHINNADWISPEYIETNVLKVMDERVMVLESIKYWLLNSFYQKTVNYSNHSGFNRHFFAHAKSDVWQNNSNFFRAIGLIQAFAFIECFAVENNNIKLWIPASDERRESFRLEVFSCLNYQSIKQTIIQKLQIENNLPFNLTASSDGWLLRASKLSETMNDYIIQRLTEKEWQCTSFADPIKEGEFITIEASKANNQKIKVALLYSCATSNETYKMLDLTCDFILYQGAHYHQSSYAYGVKAKVMPLSAWIVPD